MQGKIKWFSEEKGYGYVVSEDGQNYYFNVRGIKGTELPRNGDCVSFEVGQGNKGPRATSLEILFKATSEGRSALAQRSDDRVTCPHCGKKMVPRIITYRGSPQQSVCPFCGKTYKMS